MQSFLINRLKPVHCFAIMAITLHPSDEQLTQIEKVKKILREKSASKALFGAAAAYPKLKDASEREKQKSQRLEWALDELQLSIRSNDYARNDMMELANKTVT